MKKLLFIGYITLQMVSMNLSARNSQILGLGILTYGLADYYKKVPDCFSVRRGINVLRGTKDEKTFVEAGPEITQSEIVPKEGLSRGQKALFFGSLAAGFFILMATQGARNRAIRRAHSF